MLQEENEKKGGFICDTKKIVVFTRGSTRFQTKDIGNNLHNFTVVTLDFVHLILNQTWDLLYTNV